MLMMIGCKSEREKIGEGEKKEEKKRNISRRERERECTGNREEEESRRFFTSLKIVLFEKWTKIVEQV